MIWQTDRQKDEGCFCDLTIIGSGYLPFSILDPSYDVTYHKNLCAGGGECEGGHSDHPLRCIFREWRKNCDTHFRPIFHTFTCIFYTSFFQLSWQGLLKSGQQVRPSDPNSKIYVIAPWVQFLGIIMKLSWVDKGISTYNSTYRNVNFGYFKSSILWFDHYKATGKCSIALYAESTCESTPII